MSEKAANIVSYLFHPVWLPTVSFAFLLGLCDGGMNFTLAGKLWLLLYVFVITLIVPLLILGYLKYFKYISDFTLPTQKERITPLIASAFLQCFVGYVFSEKTESLELGALFYTFGFLSVGLLLVNFFMQVSLHAAGATVLVGVIFWSESICQTEVKFFLLMVTFLAAGLVMHARLKLNAHTPAEIWLGALLGLSGSFLIYPIDQYL